MLDDAGLTTRIHADLPIFRLDAGGQVVLYAPGSARTATPLLALQVEDSLAGRPGASLNANRIARELERYGRAAERAWQDLATRRFEPECLTLYLSNQCNLACGYCYSAPPAGAPSRVNSGLTVLNDSAFPILPEAAISAAARLVASHCAAKGRPFTLVAHGGGEPTLHWHRLQEAWTVCAAIAEEHCVPFWSYIATHGVISADRARWLAAHFHLVGLSCDGPPDIHDVNRPSAANTSTSAAVERAALVLSREGAEYIVRATITPESFARQAEILNYLCDRLLAKTARFEPAYHGHRTPGRRLQPEDAVTFVDHFLEAQAIARQCGCDLGISGVRLDEIHGPFCNPLRDVLQLTPDGRASACFLSVGNQEGFDNAMEMGCVDPASGAFLIDRERAASQRLRAARVSARCRECHNVHHCARDCPDVCLVAPDSGPEPPEGFRCRMQKLLARRQILEMAEAG